MVYLSIYLCHLWFISSVSYSFLHTSLLSLQVGLFLGIFILFVAMVNGIDSLISFSDFSFLVHRNARDFCVLILYTATLLNSLIQFRCSVAYDCLWPHGLQHARFLCLSPTPGAYSNSWPWGQWCHSTISSFVVSFSSYLQSFPASGSSPMSQFFTSGGQIIGISTSASVLLVNI